MKLKKRKIKYAAIFFLCWFGVLVLLVDGIIGFQSLVDYFDSYALVELTLSLLVALPTLAVYKLVKRIIRYDIRQTTQEILLVCEPFSPDQSPIVP